MMSFNDRPCFWYSRTSGSGFLAAFLRFVNNRQNILRHIVIKKSLRFLRANCIDNSQVIALYFLGFIELPTFLKKNYIIYQKTSYFKTLFVNANMKKKCSLNFIFSLIFLKKILVSHFFPPNLIKIMMYQKS